MIDEEFTIHEVLEVVSTKSPRKNLLDRVPVWILHYLRRVFGWPHLSPFERWEMLVIIQEEFHKQLENHLLSVEALERLESVEVPHAGHWN